MNIERGFSCGGGGGHILEKHFFFSSGLPHQEVNHRFKVVHLIAANAFFLVIKGQFGNP